MKKSFIKLMAAMFMISTLAVFVSCSDDDDGEPAPTQTIWEIIESESNLSDLEGEFLALENSDVVATLQSETANSTVFAPSNAALQQLLNTLQLTSFAPVSADIAKAVLEFHVVTSGKLAAADLAGTIATLQGESLTVDGDSLISGATTAATVQTGDIQATNGVVHVVDVVLIPPSIGAVIVQTLGTIAQPIFTARNFTILSSAIQKADATATDPTATIAAALIGGQGLTVFAPVNDALTASGITVDSFDAATWDAIIRNHVVVGQGTGEGSIIQEADLTTQATFTTLLQGTLFIVNTGTAVNAPGGPGIFIDSNNDFNGETGLNGEVAALDAAFATNGTIHAIVGLLSPN